MSNATDRPLNGPMIVERPSSTVAKVGAGAGTAGLILSLITILPQIISAFGGKPESVKPVVDTTQSIVQIIQDHPELLQLLSGIGKNQPIQPVQPVQPVLPVQPNLGIPLTIPVARLVATDSQAKELSAVSGEVVVDSGRLLIISSKGSAPAPVPDSWDISGNVNSQIGITESGYYVVPAPGEVIRFVLTVGNAAGMSKAKLVVRSKPAGTAMIESPLPAGKQVVTVFESAGKPVGNLGLWQSLRDSGYSCQVLTLERDLNMIVADPMKLKALNAALTMPPPTLVVQTAAGDVTFAGAVPDSDGKIMEAITGIVEKQPAVLVAAGPASNGIAIYSDSLARIFGEAGDSFEAHKPETQIFDTMQAAIKLAPREAFAAVMAELGEVNAIRRTGTDAQKVAADIESAKVCRAYQSQFASVSSAIRGSKF